MGKSIEYKPEYAQRLLELCKNGLSLRGAWTEMGITAFVATGWRKKYKEWDEACIVGPKYHELFFEKLGIKGALGEIQNFNAAVWIFTMKTRFGFRDYSKSAEGEMANPRELSLDQINELLAHAQNAMDELQNIAYEKAQEAETKQLPVIEVKK
jgi:hypothetical protein